MDVTKIIQKAMSQKSSEAGSIKSSTTLSRFEATKNHVSTVKGEEMSSTTCAESSSCSASKGDPSVNSDRCPKPNLPTKPQALVEKMRQERIVKKCGDKGIKDDEPRALADKTKHDEATKAEIVTKERVHGADKNSSANKVTAAGDNEPKEISGEGVSNTSKTKSSLVTTPTNDITMEQKASLEKQSKNGGSLSPSGSDVSEGNRVLSALASDTVAKASRECKGQVKSPSHNDSTGIDKATEQDGRQKHDPKINVGSSSLTVETDNKKVPRLNMRITGRHKSDSSSPSETGSKSHYVLNKQSSDTTFDRSARRGLLKRMTSNLENRLMGVVAKGEGESDDEGGEESFRTRVTRFARHKFQRAVSLASGQLHSPQVTAGV